MLFTRLLVLQCFHKYSCASFVPARLTFVNIRALVLANCLQRPFYTPCSDGFVSPPLYLFYLIPEIFKIMIIEDVKVCLNKPSQLQAGADLSLLVCVILGPKISLSTAPPTTRTSPTGRPTLSNFTHPGSVKKSSASTAHGQDFTMVVMAIAFLLCIVLGS